MKTVRWPHAVFGCLVVVGAVGLTVAAVWATGLPTHKCDEGVARPNGWIFGGLVLFALGLPAAWWLVVREYENPRWERIYLVIAEAITALLLAVYLDGKYSHFLCG